MKVAFFTDNQYRGGLDTFIVSLINHWPHADDELTLICNRTHPGLPVIASRLTRKCRIVAHAMPGHGRWYQGNTSNRFLRSRVGRFSLSMMRRAFGYPLFATYVAWLTRMFRRSDYDRLMVVNGGYPASLSCRAASIAWWRAGKRPGAVHNFHNLAMTSPGLRAPLDNAIDQAVRRASSTFVSVSEACLTSLAIRETFRDLDGYRVIYNGIESPRIASGPRPDIRAELGIEPDAPLVLMLASYEPRKGHAFFFDAFQRVLQRLPGARAICSGDGTPEEIARVEGLLAARGLTGKVFMQRFRPDVTPLLEAMDVLIIASQEFESFGLVIVEAMAFQKPVVGTRVGGIPEVIGDGGLLYERDDVAGFADGIVTYLTDADRARRDGARGFDRYRNHFTADRMARDYAQIIRDQDLQPISQ